MLCINSSILYLVLSIQISLYIYIYICTYTDIDHRQDLCVTKCTRNLALGNQGGAQPRMVPIAPAAWESPHNFDANDSALNQGCVQQKVVRN